MAWIARAYAVCSGVGLRTAIVSSLRAAARVHADPVFPAKGVRERRPRLHSPATVEDGRRLIRDAPTDPGRLEILDRLTDAVGDASDEDIAIALEIDTLSDLDVIRELDLLEALAEASEREGAG